MALTITPNLTNWTLAESSESGTWYATNITAAYNTDEYLQGSSCYSGKVDAAGTSELVYDYGSNVDLTDTVVRIWYRLMEIAKITTIDLIFYDSASAWLYYRIGRGVPGTYRYVPSPAWQYVYVDTNTDPYNAGGGTFAWNSVRRIGLSTYSSAKPNRADNVFIDAIRFGRGLIITGTNTTPGKGFEEIAADDESTSNKYGILQTLSGGGYLLTGELIFGDGSGSNSVDFTDNTNAKIFVRNNDFRGGSLSQNGCFKLVFQGNSTGTTDFQLGEVIGSGDDRKGILGGVISSDGDYIEIDQETDNSDIDSCNFYGTTFKRLGVSQFAGSTITDIIGCTFIKCGEIQPNTVEFLNNTIIGPVPDRGLEFVSSHQIKQINFIADVDTDIPLKYCLIYSTAAYPPVYEDTTDINNSTSNDVALPYYSGDYISFGSERKFTEITVNTTTTRASNVITWEYWDGSSWSALSGVTDNTTGFTVSGSQTVSWTLPSDWGTYDWDVEAKIPIYYVRARNTSTVSSGPALGQAWISNNIEHHTHFPSSGSYTASRLNFFGFGSTGTPKWHGENSSASTVTINASESNIDEDEIDDTGGGSTTVNSTADVTLTGLIANTEVRVYEAGTTTEVDGVENSGTSFTFTADTNSYVDIIIHHIEYVPIRIENYLMPTVNTSIPIQQQFDRNYSNP